MAGIDDDEGPLPKIMVLDGGFSTQLSCHVGKNVDGDPLWTARFLHTNPKEVVNTHLDFLRAGSDAIMTNSYQASVDGFVKHIGMTPEEGLALIRLSVELAKRARDIYIEECRENNVSVTPAKIVGSVGPYGACLHDGSEYSGNYADKVPAETLRDWHTPRLKALIEAGVDIVGFETIPCLREAEVLVEMLKEYPDAKAWLSFSCGDGFSLAHGENFQEAAKKCWDMNSFQLVAVGTNCCSPFKIPTLFRDINRDRSYEPIPLIAYPNSGEEYCPELGWTGNDVNEGIETFVSEWLDMGVRFIGGCCRTYSTDIARIKAQVDKWIDHKKFEEK